MKNIAKLLFVALPVLLLTASPELHAQDIGQGYSCSGNKILKKNKEVKLSKAKQAIQDKIDAVKGNNAKAKEKKAALKAIKTNLTNCTKGTFTGGGGPNADESTLIGTYQGTLNFVSVTSSGQGCQETETVSWTVYVGRSGGTGEPVIFTATSPFTGVADKGGAVGTTGFKYETNEGQPYSLSKYYEATGSDLTQSSVTMTVVQSVLKTGNLVCKSTYTGQMSRNPSDPYAD